MSDAILTDVQVENQRKIEKALKLLNRSLEYNFQDEISYYYQATGNKKYKLAATLLQELADSHGVKLKKCKFV